MGAKNYLCVLTSGTINRSGKNTQKKHESSSIIAETFLLDLSEIGNLFPSQNGKKGGRVRLIRECGSVLDSARSISDPLNTVIKRERPGTW